MNESKLISGVMVTIFLVVGLIFVFGRKNSGTIPMDPIPVATGQLIREPNHELGSIAAKVTIVEFTDFQCPACRRADPILREVIADFGDQIRFVHRNFPLTSIHPNAFNGSRAAEAAGEQGKFWEMHNKLFDSQDEWSTRPDPFPVFSTYAQDLGLDLTKFKADYSQSSVIDRIRTDMGDGTALGLNATPSIFINGQAFDQIDKAAIEAKITELLK